MTFFSRKKPKKNIPARTPVPPSPPPPPEDDPPIPANVAEGVRDALRSSGKRVRFDDLSHCLAGKNKKVWLIDIRQIQKRLMQVVDAALVHSLLESEDTLETRQRVQHAIADVFSPNGDTQRVESRINALELQIAQLTDVIRRAERLMSMATVNTTPPPTPPNESVEPSPHTAPTHDRLNGRLSTIEDPPLFDEDDDSQAPAPIDDLTPWPTEGPTQEAVPADNQVLMDIFSSNLELLRGMKENLEKQRDQADPSFN